MPSTFDDVVPNIRRLVASISHDADPISVLEAGCGSGKKVEWLFQLKPGSHIVGIDISREALDQNIVVTEKILGDIQTYPLPANAFDLIICYDVLEHLPHPDRALANFARAVKRNGIIVIASPLVHSVKGMITKLTPYRFHVLVYRYLKGDKDAGKSGHVPFPTYLRPAISPDSLVRFARNNNLSVEYLQPYSGGVWESLFTNRHILKICRTASRLVELATFRKIAAELTDFVMVLKKPACSDVRSQAA